MSYACVRSTFSDRKYSDSRSHFWRLPAEWGDPGSTFLRDIRSTGGEGAVKLLPILGHLAGLDARQWHLSIEEMARLAGVDPKTCAKVRDALTEMQLVKAWIKAHRGLPVTHWSVAPKLCAPTNTQKDFIFKLSLVHGGNWAMLTPPQAAVYIGAATRATRSATPPKSHWLLEPTLATTADITDIEEAFERADGGNAVRLATPTKRELAEMWGYSDKSITDAVRAFRHPDHWPNCTNNRIDLAFSPLRVYPVDKGSLLFHFRDHVPHWPWEVLNGGDAAESDGDGTLGFAGGVSA